MLLGYLHNIHIPDNVYIDLKNIKKSPRTFLYKTMQEDFLSTKSKVSLTQNIFMLPNTFLSL